MNIVIDLNKEGISFYTKKDFIKAINCFHRALKNIKNENKEIATCYYNLGSAYYEISNIDEAIIYLSKSVHIYQHLYGNEHNKTKKSQDKYNNVLKRKQIVVNLYKSITSNIYINQSFDFMIAEIKHVKIFLSEQADIFRMNNYYKNIHSALLIEDFDEFDIHILYDYTELFKMNISKDLNFYIDDKNGKIILSNKIIHEKYRQLQILRIHKYIMDVLFNNKKDDFIGKLTYYCHPSYDNIIKNGIECFYPKISDIYLNNQQILAKYFSYYELLHIVSIFYNLEEFIDENSTFNIHNKYKYEDLDQFIVTALQKIKFNNTDKYVLTMFGIKQLNNN